MSSPIGKGPTSASMVYCNALPPSKNGIGSRLNSAIFMLTTARISAKYCGLRARLCPVITIIIPIGPCEPREWMKKTHMDSYESGRAFLDLAATHFMPMHWGTFSFGVDHFSMPFDKLRSWWASQ